MKISLIALGLLMASKLALAAHGHGGGDREQHRAYMQQALGLSSEQIEQMEEIRERGGSREDMREVLTEEQQEKAQQMREKHKGKFAKRLTRMQQHLNLSDEQVAQIQAIREDGGSRDEVHSVLTEEQLTQLEEKRARHPHRGGNRE